VCSVFVRAQPARHRLSELIYMIAMMHKGHIT
jgi:hypothetical protein